MKYYKLPQLLILTCLFFLSCRDKKNNEQVTKVRDTMTIHYSVITTLPHDTEAFTQGLIISNNKILESTGQNNSWIAEVDPTTGAQNKKITLESQYFGEGITQLHNKIYQLTWKSKIGFIYNASTYKKIGEFSYPMEGWGITHDNKNLIMSDGGEKLYFLDTATFKVTRSVTVRDGNLNVKKLNELEYIDGYIFANVWYESIIIKIDPSNGKVIGRLDLSNLTNEIEQMYPEADVLNGIAYDKKSKALLVTGKLWPKAYLIRLQ